MHIYIRRCNRELESQSIRSVFYKQSVPLTRAVSVFKTMKGRTAKGTSLAHKPQLNLGRISFSSNDTNIYIYIYPTLSFPSPRAALSSIFSRFFFSHGKEKKEKKSKRKKKKEEKLAWSVG